MALQARDREFRHLRISYLDFKHLEMDRVLTSFLARLNHGGYPSRIYRKFELTVEQFYLEFSEHPEMFAGFSDHEDVARRWIETHLMDMVNRGRLEQAIAAPRPLHGLTYRFRNPKHSRPYGADEHLYTMIEHARGDRGPVVLEYLKEFFFAGIDRNTLRESQSAEIDVETQALLRLAAVRNMEDNRDDRKPRESYSPLCIGGADLLVDDIRRLLLYQRFIPRSVMVDYLKTLISFHMGLYHLRLLKLLPALVRRKSGDPACLSSSCPMKPSEFRSPQGDCPYQFGLLLDVANRPHLPMARLAEQSADLWFRRIPAFVKAYFTIKKLDELAGYLAKQDKLKRPASGFAIEDVLPLLEGMYKGERSTYFDKRVQGIVEDSGGSDEDAPPEVKRILEMGLAPLDTFIEIIMVYRGDFHRKYVVQCLDALLMKGRTGALLTQPRVKGGRRRFILDSRLLEVLLQIAVLRPGGRNHFHTEALRIEELLGFFRERYGLFIDQLPPGDGFGPPSIEERASLRENTTAFVGRLREVAFFQDLSDAYIMQTVTPRYEVTP